MMPWLKNEKSVCGRSRIRQRVEEWISLIGGTRSVCA